jgi:hypothetical protein
MLKKQVETPAVKPGMCFIFGLFLLAAFFSIGRIHWQLL